MRDCTPFSPAYDTQGEMEDLFLPGSLRFPIQSPLTTRMGMHKICAIQFLLDLLKLSPVINLLTNVIQFCLQKSSYQFNGLKFIHIKIRLPKYFVSAWLFQRLVDIIKYMWNIGKCLEIRNWAFIPVCVSLITEVDQFCFILIIILRYPNHGLVKISTCRIAF
jgi:hypothetical protein